jgi:transposase
LGGERVAAIFTLIITAKLNGLDPRTWLADALRRLRIIRAGQPMAGH